MATPSSLTTPGGGFVSEDPFVRARLIAMGATGASPDSQVQTIAQSMISPGRVVGGAYGTDPRGFQTQIQAYTSNGREGIEGTPGQSMSSAPDFVPAGPNMPQRSQYSSDQAYLDAYNAYQRNGQPSYVPRSSSSPSGTGASGSPTIGQAYGSYAPTGNPELDAAYAAQGDLIKKTQEPIDEQAIRDRVLRDFQSEIDATNRYYAELKQQRLDAERPQAENRLGSNAAIQARRGLIGSDFGQRQTDVTMDYNAKVAASIAEAVDAERANAVQAILGKARLQSQKEIDDKVAARKQGAQEYIDFLKGAAERKDQRVASAVANMVSAGKELSDADYTAIAKELGIDEATLRTKFKEAKSTEQKTAAENAPKPIVIDGVGYVRQTDGTYKAVTPTKSEQEKPINVGGVAYVRQEDGTYKAVTPEKTTQQKVLTRQVGKQLYTSTDGGLTWAPSKTTSGANLPAAPTTTKPKAVTSAQQIAAAEKAMSQQLAQLMGGDGFISPEAYSIAKREWVNQGFNPTTFDTKFRGFRNPENPYYTVGGNASR